jgi:hypothetical protein
LPHPISALRLYGALLLNDLDLYAGILFVYVEFIGIAYHIAPAVIMQHTGRHQSVLDNLAAKATDIIQVPALVLLIPGEF